MIFDYFDSVSEAIEFLVALGSLIGVLGLIIGIIGWFSTGKFHRHKMIGIIIGSFVLLMICGLRTGFRYFYIYH
jgi:Ca2+/Na+ antiporter